MKSLFQSKYLHRTACMLLFWKGISMLVWILLQQSGTPGNGEYFFSSTGFVSALGLLAVAAVSDSRTLSLIVLAVMCITFLAYWVFFALLAINRSGAGVASVVLLVFCALDLPLTVGSSFEQWWSLLVCVVFHAAIFITVALLRRSRPGAPVPLSELPDSI